MSEQKEHFYEFGPFRIDAVKRRLFREDEPVPLKPKAFDTLLVLIEHSGKVVDKEDLMKRLWPDSFVEEANLSVNISTLRKALGESPQEHRYIVTVPGRGYGFVANVTERWDEEAELIVRQRTSAEIIIEEETDAPDEAALAQGLIFDASGRSASNLQRPAAKLRLNRRSARLALLAALIVVAGLALAFLAYRLNSRKHSTTPFERVKLNRLTTTGKAINADISPDGKFVAFAVADAGQQSLWIRQVATTSNVQIMPPSEVGYIGLTFSRDGNYVYYVRSESAGPGILYRVPVLGGASIKLAEDVDTPVTLSPDGLRLAFMRGLPDHGETALMLTSADGGSERRLVSLKGNPNYFLAGKGPAWSPDGKRIAYAAKSIDDRGEYHYLVEVEVESGEIRPIGSRRWQQMGRAAWLADGRALLITASYEDASLAQQIWRVSYPNGEAQKITNDLNDYRNVSLTADSKTLITIQSDQQANIWVAPEPAEADRAIRITSGNYDGLSGLAWTPGGKIIYTAQASGNQNLWVADQDGSNPKQLTTGEGNNRLPSVAPDGRHVVFVSDRTGARHLWRMSIDGSQLTELTGGLDDDSPNFSPDGQWVVYRSYTFGNPNLLRVPVGGGSPVRLTDKISVKPAVSPVDGMIACFYRDPALSPNKLVLIPFAGGQPVKTLDLPFSTAILRWSTDGRALTYIKTRGGVSNIWRQPLDGGPPVQLTDFKSERIFWFDWSRDGQTLACARGVVTNDVVMISDIE
ncbi:MAG: DPP IV N-terminal domain-containing protein [Pyrinomonadaceae bacterium]